MAWFIQPLEIKGEDDKSTGRFRLTARSDEDGGGPFGLCAHEQGHPNADEAQQCPDARERAKAYG